MVDVSWASKPKGHLPVLVICPWSKCRVSRYTSTPFSFVLFVEKRQDVKVVEYASFVNWLQNAFVWVFGFLCDIELIYWSPHMCCVCLGWDTWQCLPILSRNNCCRSGPAETFFKRSLLPLVRPVTMSYDSAVTSSTFSEGLILMVDRYTQHTQPRNNVLLSIVRHCGVILVMTLAFGGTRSGLCYTMGAGGTVPKCFGWNFLHLVAQYVECWCATLVAQVWFWSCLVQSQLLQGGKTNHLLPNFTMSDQPFICKIYSIS